MTQQTARGESAQNSLALHVGTVSFALVKIPAGEFQMGSPPGEQGHQENEAPVHHVHITKAFYLGKYEVTQAQYREIIGAKTSRFHGDQLAMDEVTFRQALAFCAELSRRCGHKVTLPTEAQWEYACRAGTQTRFYSGNTSTDLDKAGWYAGNAQKRVHEIGQKQPNAWGLYDMHGNVWEFCADSVTDYHALPEADPKGETHEDRGTMRGGGYMYDAEDCRSAKRMLTDDRFGGAGIRIAINEENIK